MEFQRSAPVREIRSGGRIEPVVAAAITWGGTRKCASDNLSMEGARRYDLAKFAPPLSFRTCSRDLTFAIALLQAIRFP